MNASLYAAKPTDFKNPEETVLAIHEAGGIAAGSNLGVQLRRAVYSDQVPPFDITLYGANEYGQIASMSIYGAEILNEGAGLSIDDIINETQMTFVARALVPWTPVERPGSATMDLGAQSFQVGA